MSKVWPVGMCFRWDNFWACITLGAFVLVGLLRTWFAFSYWWFVAVYPSALLASYVATHLKLRRIRRELELYRPH